MRVPTLLGLSVLFALPLGFAGPSAAGCDALGKIQFVCGVTSPEDLALVPGSEWIVTSGNRPGSGAIRLINVRDKTATILFPTPGFKARPDTKTYPTCPGPIDSADPTEKAKSQAHGIYLKPGKGSVHTLHIVHHGSRESIEVFELDAGAKPPALTWIGCAVAPENALFNAVVALPEGGFAATNTPRVPGAPRPVTAGETPGGVWEWHTATGWKMVPGSDEDRPNGLEISKDGKWFYIAGWGKQTFVRLSRGQTPVKKDAVPSGFHIDNLRAAPDGSLFAAGQGGTALCSCPTETSNVAKIDPKTLKVQKIISFPYTEGFVATTTAMQVGNEIWLGSNRGDRVGHFPAPSQ